jgi:hypothetical protein
MSSTLTQLSLPAEFLPAFQAILDHVSEFGDAAMRGEEDFAASESRLGRLFAEAETQCLGAMLRGLDPVEERVEVDGFTWRRMKLRTAETYFTLRGPVRVARGLYRREDIRNGPTLVPLDLRAGMVEGRYTPAAAKAAAILAQAHPSREADTIAKALGVLPYSRSSQLRAGADIGTRWDTIRLDAEPGLAESMTIPKAAAAVSVAADRVALPMSEPRTPTPEDLEAGVKRPVDVTYRMAFTGVLTVYDADGEPLTCIRYAHTPQGGAEAIRSAMGRDLDQILLRRTDLKVVTLSDGAPDMQELVDGATGDHPVVARLTDIWHLVEKLGAALRDTGRYVQDQLADWKADLLERDDSIDRIERQLIAWKQGYPSDKIPDGLHAAITYIENRRERLRYATVRSAGLPIGSGTAEATCKTIVTMRMRRPGASWTDDGAQAILGLRALATSSTERWERALDRVIDSYKRHVKPLPPRPSRAG